MEHDADLIEQLRLGDRDAFEQLILRYQNLIYTVCLKIVTDTYDAENMAQETFLTAYGSLSGFRGESLKSWLCRIAVNKSIDFKRRQARLILTDFDERAQQVEASAEDSVEQTFERRERSQKLEKILSGMPGKYAAVINAFYYRRLTVKEIALRMELPERTVETRLYRAKKMIRERWGDDGC